MKTSQKKKNQLPIFFYNTELVSE